MYSNKFAAKLVNIRQLCKKIMDNLNIFIVLSTYYFTFRIRTVAVFHARLQTFEGYARIVSADNDSTYISPSSRVYGPCAATLRPVLKTLLLDIICAFYEDS